MKEIIESTGRLVVRVTGYAVKSSVGKLAQSKDLLLLTSWFSHFLPMAKSFTSVSHSVTCKVQKRTPATTIATGTCAGHWVRLTGCTDFPSGGSTGG